MKWDTKPVTEDFELLEVPSSVDVRRLMDGMKLTITDSVEEEDDYERTVKLPAAKPVPAEWLLENSGLTLEESTPDEESESGLRSSPRCRLACPSSR